jgi:polyhydroxybutyrate depolymerase
MAMAGSMGLVACGTDETAEDDDNAPPPPYVGVGNLSAPAPNNAPGSSAGTPNASGTPAGTESPQVSGLAPAGGTTPAPGTQQPPAQQPPVQQQPGMQPPAVQPPAMQPPAMQPPVQQPPANLPASASEGCGLSQGIPASTNVANTILTFPPTYNGSTPVPLLFHGAGRTNTDMRMVDSRTMGSQLENNYVVAFMKSAGNAWDLGTDYPRFEAALDQILAERCIDTNALFAMGHSSGAQFIVQMLGDNRARETRFAAVVPVSSSLFNNPVWEPVPTMLLHGEADTQRPADLDGTQDISQYVRSNQCQNTTQAVAVPGCASLAGGVAVNAGCVQYNGCAAPTLFCRHDDPNYLDNGNPTNHGWPCFANSQIFSFLESNR